MPKQTNKVKYVSYYPRRVNRGGVDRFVSYNDGRLVGEYVEGKRQWPKLLAAIERCKTEAATLLISKLGRLGRNPRFLALLKESGIDFACCDDPNVNKFTVHILVGVAEEESAKISERTKNAMAEARKRGVKLGSHRPGHWEGREHLRGTRQAIAQSAKMRRIRTQKTYEFLLPTLKEMREAGQTMDEIAQWLNDNGHTTTVGHPFNETSVWRLCKRYLGDEYLGKVKDRGGNPQVLRCMEKTA